MSDELARERATLIRADRDIEQGRARVLRQEEIVNDLIAKAEPIEDAQNLLGILRDTLSQWEAHRTQIIERIAYLEQG